jgi:hypothetical protein
MFGLLLIAYKFVPSKSLTETNSRELYLLFVRIKQEVTNCAYIKLYAIEN